MIDAAALGPDAIAELAERDQRLRQLIGELPEEKREVLRLVHDEGFEIRDAAETLGIPEGTVKSRLHYALKNLAAKWQDMERQDKRWEE